jgi:uncharacterized protein
MSHVDANQPDGTPTWIDLGIPDLDRAMEFYGAVLGWEFDVGPEEYGRYTTCLLHGRAAAAMAPNHDPAATEFWWNVYFAASDCDATAAKVVEAGGIVLVEPAEVGPFGRSAVVQDAVGAQFGLWQGREHNGCAVVNEPGALVRNDLITPNPAPARDFYAAVFGFTLDRNPDMPETDFTFLRRSDGHEVGGIFGNPAAARSTWNTTFEVADTDAAVAAALAHGGKSNGASDMLYGRIATVLDPFGAEFSVITRAG